jgi:two-component system, LytTR family, sensor kinase
MLAQPTTDPVGPSTTEGNLPARAAAPHRSPLTGQWWLASAFWVLIALGAGLEMSLSQGSDLAESLRFASLQWLPWALVTPIIMWLSSAFTIERSTWHRTIWIHLAACVIIVGGMGALAQMQGPPPFRRDMARPFPRPEPGPGHFVLLRRGPPPEIMMLRLATSQLPTFWAVVGVAHALRFYQRAKDRERRESELESRLVQVRLQALRMQLNPHFLFNTLNSIASLLYEDPRAADEMIGSLSELLRLTLTDSDRQEVTLREELHFLDRYLLIEQTRFGERLRIDKEIEPEAMETIVPILILQPLVENAVKHGIEAQLAPGVIRISARRAGEFLHLQVADNGCGPGMTADGKLKEGVGLSNTRSRLKELYGDRGSVEFHSPAEGGFIVDIRIPWRMLSGVQAVDNEPKP